MTNCPDKAYDEHRQACADDGICHLCEGEGCPRCKKKEPKPLPVGPHDRSWCG